MSTSGAPSATSYVSLTGLPHNFENDGTIESKKVRLLLRLKNSHYLFLNSIFYLFYFLFCSF